MRVSDINPGEVKWVRTRIDGPPIRATVGRSGFIRVRPVEAEMPF